MRKIGIIFGGKSDEHEISILSASSIISAVDKTKYEVVQIGISKTGDWYHITDKMDDIESLEDRRINTIIPTDNQTNVKRIKFGDLKEIIDFAFPALHGPFGEDGTIQGMFEIMDIPYAGCGVTASALSMDKIFAKEIWIRAGLPVLDHVSVNAYEFEKEKNNCIDRIESKLGYPVFIKPANMGSSVGISRADSRDILEKSIIAALRYDNRVIIEKENIGRELETAILGNNIISAASVGEIVTTGTFYDYEAKYNDGISELCIPAHISGEKVEEVRTLAKKAYKALDGSGFARVDFFMEKSTDKIYINEMNTIPGFTKYSMFPLLWDNAGTEYSQLIERIIELGYERYNAKNNR